ncbi:MAG: 2-hydroxyacid dehydrogenase [Alphaproteobacteria bacterium]|nr:2-hydroxyacid dehydrogenase [Alphaproteobacteria bacterium]
MEVAVFSAKPHDRRFLDEANVEAGHRLDYIEARLDRHTIGAANDAAAVCAFVSDSIDEAVLVALARRGVRLVALRAAGFNNIDLAAAKRHGITVARVPEYSPPAIDEHTVALVLTLNRKIHRTHARVREGNFALDGLLGFDLHGKTVGIVGTGRIGLAFARIMQGFGMRRLASAPKPDPEATRLGVAYVGLAELLADADIVSLHCPLTPATHHLIDARAIAAMKPGVMLINTSRGAVVDTRAVIDGLKSGRIGHLGLDVYEEEGDLFFENLSDMVMQDDVFARLLTFPNVVVTGHQAFFTAEVLRAIARTTIDNITRFERTGAPVHAVSTEHLA